MELVCPSPELIPASVTPFFDASYPHTTVRRQCQQQQRDPFSPKRKAAAVEAGQVAGASIVRKPSRKRKKQLRRSNSLPETQKVSGTFNMSGFEIDEGALASHYQLLEELGSGSFGVVYKAIEKLTGEIVAIKHIDLESSEEDIQEIQGEISVLSTCSSPYVTQYKTSFLRGSKLWIVMEYLGGGSCQDLLKPGPFNESHVAIICRELLLGLDYLHREGKIHRDIKAANVLLAQSGRVKLADFGVAAQLSNIKSIRMTFVGTPFWMAPEVIQESGYDFKADIWSLGITAMEMINGAPPHADVHPMKVLFLIPKEAAPRLHGDYYSREMKDFIASCLVKDPEQRPTAKELLRHPFIRRAGKVEGLQEVILRRQEWEAARGKANHLRYYEETMRAMPAAEVGDSDAWTFDTVKAATIAKQPQQTMSRRQVSLSRSSTLVEDDSTFPEEIEETLADLSISVKPTQFDSQTQWLSPTSKKKPRVSTVRHVSNAANSPKRRTSSAKIISSPSKRKSSLMGTTQHKPLAADMAYGNSESDDRPFRRVSGPVPPPPLPSRAGGLAYPPGLEPKNDAQTDTTQAPFLEPYPPPAPSMRQQNNTPTATFITRDALLGHRAFSKCVDPALQEAYAQTGDYARRDALGRAATALADLNASDPEGLWNLLVGAYSRISQDAKLRDVLASRAGLPLQMPSSRPPSGNMLNGLAAPPGILSPSSGNTGSPADKENASSKHKRRSSQIQPSGPRFVLAENNPHLKSHRRRQSSFMPASQDPLGVGSGLGRKNALDSLPGEPIPGMEHTKQLADVLYGGWVGGLKGRWPQV